jgi:hypothetical protein
MKAPVFYKIFFVTLFFYSYHFTSAQVGIGTKTARKTLEVAGDVLISGNIDIGMYNPLKDNDVSTFLIQESDASIKSVDVSNPTGVALAYIQEYYIVNPNLDWVKNFDTGIDATDFVVIVTSASFDQELDLTDATGDEENFSIPYTATFVQAGTWRIIADYPQSANLDETAIGTWTINTLIFSSDVSKQFGTIDIPMSNGTSGSAITPIID